MQKCTKTLEEFVLISCSFEGAGCDLEREDASKEDGGENMDKRGSRVDGHGDNNGKGTGGGEEIKDVGSGCGVGGASLFDGGGNDGDDNRENRIGDDCNEEVVEDEEADDDNVNEEIENVVLIIDEGQCQRQCMACAMSALHRVFSFTAL